jgi:hypothetical protein
MKTHLHLARAAAQAQVHRRTWIHSYPSYAHSNAQHLNLQSMAKNETAAAGAKDKQWRVLAPGVSFWEMRWD